MTRLGLFYVRFMDDILVLAPTRWKLRKAVAVVNRKLGALRALKSPATRPSSVGPRRASTFCRGKKVSGKKVSGKGVTGKR